MIPVGTYAGQANLKFGFKYSNTAAALVGVVFDNIKIWMGADIAIESAIGGTNPANGKGYQLVNTAAPIKGTIKNMGTTTITNYTVWYKQGANPAVSYAATGSIAPLATATFTHATPFTTPANTAYPIKVWVVLASDNNHTNDSTNIDVTGVPFLPVKKLVLEEGTGTWCGWCPRGSVFMEEFAEDNVNKVAQIAVHNNDPMEVSAYDTYMGSYVGGFPNMVVDRTLDTDPSNIDEVYTTLKDNFAFAEVTMGTPTVSGTTVTVPVTVKPAVAITNPKLALVVTESNVKGTGAQWPQVNYYAGGGNGPMGGWESQPAQVTNVNFHFVARSISPSPAGEASGLPGTLAAGTTYTATLTGTLNSAWKTADLQYIVLFMNGTDATVMNSAFTALPTLKPGLPTSVTNLEAGIEKAQLYPNPTTGLAYLQVELKEATNGTLTITDAVGRSVSPAKTTAMRSGTTVLEIPTEHLATGMYLINLSTEKGNVAMKLQVLK
jgi:thiol-disulfide isomerase/thioredoxin